MAATASTLGSRTLSGPTREACPNEQSTISQLCSGGWLASGSPSSLGTVKSPRWIISSATRARRSSSLTSGWLAMSRR